jgi:hypothetical protein
LIGLKLETRILRMKDMNKLNIQEMELLRGLADAARRGHLRNKATGKQFGEANVIKHTEKCRLQ